MTGPPPAPSDQGGDPPCWAHLFEDEAAGEPGVRIDTPLCSLLGIDHPILLAPMGGIAGGRLAAAVSAAGGLGLVGGGYGDPTWLEDELAAAGDARVGIGFITFRLETRPGTLRIALDRHPPVIQLSFGDVRPYSEQIHDAGALLVCQVQSVAEAARARDAGADVIIAQGQDAGGHGRPLRGTIGLVPAVVDEVAPVPVVAAGGMADGRGLAAALMLGAAGITLGTRFYAATEAIAERSAVARLVEATGDDTVRTPVFDRLRGPAWPEGYDGRVVRNRTVDRWHDPDELAAHHEEASLEFRAAPDDDYSVKPLWAGEGLDLVHGPATAASIIADVVGSAARRIREAAEDRLRPGR